MVRKNTLFSLKISRETSDRNWLQKDNLKDNCKLLLNLTLILLMFWWVSSEPWLGFLAILEDSQNQKLLQRAR